MNADNRPEHIKQAAAVALKNALVAPRDPTRYILLLLYSFRRRAQQAARWQALPTPLRAQLETAALSALAQPSAAQVVAAMAALELPQGGWPTLLPTLIGNVVSEGGSSRVLRKHTLECLGFLCEQLDSDVLCCHSDALLTAIVNGLRSDSEDLACRIAAAQSLLVALPFVGANLGRPNELSVIMQSVCEACVPGLTDSQNGKQ